MRHPLQHKAIPLAHLCADRHSSVHRRSSEGVCESRSSTIRASHRLRQLFAKRVESGTTRTTFAYVMCANCIGNKQL
jgi:hypothetical protein